MELLTSRASPTREPQRTGGSASLPLGSRKPPESVEKSLTGELFSRLELQQAHPRRSRRKQAARFVRSSCGSLLLLTASQDQRILPLYRSYSSVRRPCFQDALCPRTLSQSQRNPSPSLSRMARLVARIPRAGQTLATRFHIVIPSMPGYAFSDPPPADSEFGKQDVAVLMERLMQRLGYEGYAVQVGHFTSFGLTSPIDLAGWRLGRVHRTNHSRRIRFGSLRSSQLCQPRSWTDGPQ